MVDLNWNLGLVNNNLREFSKLRAYKLQTKYMFA